MSFEEWVEHAQRELPFRISAHMIPLLRAAWNESKKEIKKPTERF